MATMVSTSRLLASLLTCCLGGARLPTVGRVLLARRPLEELLDVISGSTSPLGAGPSMALLGSLAHLQIWLGLLEERVLLCATEASRQCLLQKPTTSSGTKAEEAACHTHPDKVSARLPFERKERWSGLLWCARDTGAAARGGGREAHRPNDRVSCLCLLSARLQALDTEMQCVTT